MTKEHMRMEYKLEILAAIYERLTRMLLTHPNRNSNYHQYLQRRRQTAANNIWEVKQWLYTH